jgi:hypothetical protein
MAAPAPLLKWVDASANKGHIQERVVAFPCDFCQPATEGAVSIVFEARYLSFSQEFQQIAGEVGQGMSAGGGRVQKGRELPV